MSGSPQKASKKPRKKAIEPPLTLKSRLVLLSKDRQELYSPGFPTKIATCSPRS